MNNQSEAQRFFSASLVLFCNKHPHEVCDCSTNFLSFGVWLITRTGQITNMYAQTACATMLIIVLPHNQPNLTATGMAHPKRVFIR